MLTKYPSDAEESSLSEVQLVIHSNWGHPKYVGLTEVRLIDDDNAPLSILESNIQVKGCCEQIGHLTNVIDGKTKTINDKHMWCCAFSRHQPVIITIKIRTFSYSIQYLCIWNYNRSIKDLEIGANDISVYLNSSLAFEGRIERGCGNPVFDYGQCISLHSRDLLQSPNTMNETTSYCSKTESSASSSESSDEKFLQPKWLEEFRQANSRCATDTDSSCSNSRVSSGRSIGESRRSYNASSRSVLGTDSLYGPLDDSSADLEIASPSSSSATIDDFNTVRQKRENSAQFGRRAPKSAVAESKPEQGNNSQLTLEEKISSLHNFEQRHRGRLTTDLSADAFSQYLSSALDAGGRKAAVSVARSSHLIKSTTTDVPDDDFVIPELPKGNQMVIGIKTTWGDRHYVGLNGIEIFSNTGEPVTIADIWADPADINVLPEYSNDPRVVTNLINGIYQTKDDLNLWLAPFTPGQDHLITINFANRVTVAMIRIWNYNKSRIHSYRGVRDISITLDGVCIFKGEIAKACGGGLIERTEAYGDTILFTLDDEILENILNHDENFIRTSSEAWEEQEEEVMPRPITGGESSLGEEERPFTSAEAPRNWDPKSVETQLLNACQRLEGRVLCFRILSNYGDESRVGLTGLEVLGEDGETLRITPEMVETSLVDHDAQNLLDDVNVTTNVDHMWSAPFDGEHEITITVYLNDDDELEVCSGIRVWNYNASMEDSYIGVRLLSVSLDGNILGPTTGLLLRRAPGNCHFDFAQEINFSLPLPYSQLTNSDEDVFSRRRSAVNTSRMSAFQEYEPVMSPRGFVFQLQLLTTWGDPYYVGLNGLEVYDADGVKIKLTDGDVAAYPDSVNVLEGICDDARTPDKLIDGINDTRDGRHMWLAPILPNIINRVYIIFDFPVAVSKIKLWNYAKTTSRGVKDFAILVDDLLVYQGVLSQAETDRPVPYRTVLFTTDKTVYQEEKHAIIRNEESEQDVQMTNDRHIVHHTKNQNKVDQAQRPFTSLSSKPTTKYVGWTNR